MIELLLEVPKPAFEVDVDAIVSAISWPAATWLCAREARKMYTVYKRYTFDK